MYGEGTISNCYATGLVTAGSGSSHLGGLCGSNSPRYGEGPIRNCYATGLVTAGSSSSHLGGFCGESDDTIISYCYFLDIAGPDNGLGVPLTDSQMKQQSSFFSWDFTKIWAICEGTNYPKLTWQVPIEGDFLCPDGVDFIDYSVLADQWQLEKVEQDLNFDGTVNFCDLAELANEWDGDYSALETFLTYWLGRSARQADIAPVGGDDVVDWQDLKLFCENWFKEE
jgi:hypothetical protein